MKTINTNRIAVAVAALGLTAVPFLTGVAQAKDKGRGHDNGRHLGWSKGVGNKHDDDRRDDRRDNRRDDRWNRRDDRRDDWRNRNTNWRPASTSRSSRSTKTRYFGTQRSAQRASDMRDHAGYRSDVKWDPKRRAYRVTESSRRYNNSRYNSRRYNTRRTTPVSSRSLVGTHYYPTQASAAAGVRFAQAKGYRATSTYNRSQNRWIVRVYS